MDSINKVVSFVLGLTVVVVFLLLITGRLNVFKSTSLITARENIKVLTPTKSVNVNDSISPTPSNTVTPTPESLEGDQQMAANLENVESIPDTGAPTYVMIFFSIMLVGGAYLRKTVS